jgi:hypothetical protein
MGFFCEACFEGDGGAVHAGAGANPSDNNKQTNKTPIHRVTQGLAHGSPLHHTPAMHLPQRGLLRQHLRSRPRRRISSAPPGSPPSIISPGHLNALLTLRKGWKGVVFGRRRQSLVRQDAPGSGSTVARACLLREHSRSEAPVVAHHHGTTRSAMACALHAMDSLHVFLLTTCRGTVRALIHLENEKPFPWRAGFSPVPRSIIIVNTGVTPTKTESHTQKSPVDAVIYCESGGKS